MMNPRTLNRRQLLRLGAGSLIAAGIWPGALFAEEKAQSEEFHFLVVNDIHYQDKGCADWLQKVIKQMKGHAEKTDFCILAGDLAELGRLDQLGAMRELCKSLDKPVHVVIGNHDYLTQKDRNAYVKHFPDRLNYRFEHRGWQFVGLDTTEGQLSRNTTIHADTLHWLDTTLPKLDKKKPMVMFTHFPMGPFVIGRPKNADNLLERFREFNLQAVYCGHWHGFTEREVRHTVFTTNRCCSFRRKNHDGTKEKGYFLCHAKDGKIKRKFVQVNFV
jgi:3',5'-cyclic AMP phosphodiesterase CpdA